MVCMDGFILTHATEEVEVPTLEQVQGFLPPFEPRQVLDPADPVSIGAMVGPEAYTEVRYLAHEKQMQALELIPQVAEEFQAHFGREAGGLVRTYHCDDAETVVIALGSVLGTIKDVVDERRAKGEKIGVLGICSFRPFPLDAVREALDGAKRFVSLEKAFSVGIGGIVASHVRMALSAHPLKNYTVVAGLGGRQILKTSLHSMLDKAVADELPFLTFLDLDEELVERELARERSERRSGPTAENILRDLGAVRATPV
jgi:pyruvate ferredoxin oxidoreductase alpha subunit